MESCLKVYCSTDSMTSRELKSHRNVHLVRGRPTGKDVEHVRNGSVRMPYERSIYERTFMIELIENHVIPNELSNLTLDKKHLQKRHRNFRGYREPSRIPVRTLQRLSNKRRKVREFVYKCICSSTPKSSKMHCYIKVLGKIILNPLRKYVNV